MFSSHVNLRKSKTTVFKNSSIYILLGDQAFTNGFQGLVCAKDMNLKVVYIICNNGRSVSLTKQTVHDSDLQLDNYGGAQLNKFLCNSKSMDYVQIACALNINSTKIDFSKNTEDKVKELRMAFENARKINGPTVIELIISDDYEIWDGVWALEGLDSVRR